MNTKKTFLSNKIIQSLKNNAYFIMSNIVLIFSFNKCLLSVYLSTNDFNLFIFISTILFCTSYPAFSLICLLLFYCNPDIWIT